MNKILLFLTLLILHTFILKAQLEKIQSYQITTKDGLSDNRVTCILKDSRGFMWFGTPSGLCRYDGYKFTVYQNDDLDSNTISSNNIRGLLEDLDGNLWILTEFELNRFNQKNETFTRFKIKSDNRGNISMILLQPDKIWLVEWANQLWQFDIASQKFSPIILDPAESDSLFNGQVVALFEDKDGDLWLGTTGGGVFTYDLANDKKLIAHYQHDPQDNSSLSNNTVYSLYQDRSGTIWCGTENGMNRLVQTRESSNKAEFVRYLQDPGNPYSISGNTVYAFNEDDTGILWLRTNKGLNTYNRKTGQFSNWKHNDLLVYSAETYLANHTLYIDDSNIIWMGLFEHGLMKFRLNKNKFHTIQHEPKNNNSLIDNNVSCFLMDTTGVLWVGTWNDGLNVRVPGKKRSDSPNWILYKHESGNPSSISGNQIRSIFRDRFGDLWIGTGSGGLNKIVEGENKKSKFIHYYPDSPEVGNAKRVELIHEDRAGTLWIGTASGLYIFDRQEEQFFQYVFDSLNPDSIAIRWGNALGETSSGEIWISSWSDGLFKISPPLITKDPNTVTGTKNVSYKYGDNTPKGLGDWTIETLCVPKIHKNTLVWIGTAGGGLFGLRQVKDPDGLNKEEFVHYTTIDGLSDNTIHGIEEDKKGNLWISTGNGLSRFNPETETFINYYEEDGINSNVFGWKSHYTSPDNELFFLNDGILSFYPDSIPQNNIIPPVVITEIRLFNQALKIGSDLPLKVSPIEARGITLSNDQNYLTFEFAALNYFKTEQNRYRYRLEGQDIDWVDAGTERTASYQNLHPGRYTFRVIASNNDGVWNEEGAVLKITIKPPWWKTIVAYFSYLMIIGVFIFFYNRYRVNKMDKEKRVLEDKVRERTIQLEEHKEELEAQKEELHQQKEELQQTLDYLKEMQNQLVQSEKLASIGQLTAGIAHEINNPVNYINAGIDSLNTNLADIDQVLDLYEQITPENSGEKLGIIKETKEKIAYNEAREEIKSLIKSIKKGSERTTEIVKGLRVFSRLDEDELKQADIHEGIDLTLVMLHNKYKLHVEIVKEYGTIPLITCYPGKLNQVFMNVISNAIDAIEEKGTITIKTYKDPVNGMICISIRDTGKGMSEQVKGKIFDPFFTTKDVGSGTGLGLSVSHGIIEQHNGLIEVESEPGKGTKFVISLPMKQNAEGK